jgi:hypothetical protein
VHQFEAPELRDRCPVEETRDRVAVDLDRHELVADPEARPNLVPGRFVARRRACSRAASRSSGDRIDGRRDASCRSFPRTTIPGRACGPAPPRPDQRVVMLRPRADLARLRGSLPPARQSVPEAVEGRPRAVAPKIGQGAPAMRRERVGRRRDWWRAACDGHWSDDRGSRSPSGRRLMSMGSMPRPTLGISVERTVPQRSQTASTRPISVSLPAVAMDCQWWPSLGIVDPPCFRDGWGLATGHDTAPVQRAARRT